MSHGCGSSGGRGRAAGLTACRTRLPTASHPAHRPHRPHPPRTGRRTEPRRCDSDVAATTSLPHRRGYQGRPHRTGPRCLHHAHHGHRLPPVPGAHSGRAAPMWQRTGWNRCPAGTGTPSHRAGQGTGRPGSRQGPGGHEMVQTGHLSGSHHAVDAACPGMLPSGVRRLATIIAGLVGCVRLGDRSSAAFG